MLFRSLIVSRDINDKITMAAGTMTFDISNGASGVAQFNSAVVKCGEIECSSDVRLKRDIQSISPARGADVIRHLNPTTWEWRDGGKKSSGIVAQELEQVLPEIVGDAGHKTIKYHALSGYIVAALQDLQDRVLRQDETIRRLRRELDGVPVAAAVVAEL